MLRLPKKVTTKYNDIEIILIGAGGTGGFLIENLYRLIKYKKDKNISLTVIDGDYIEEKNLERQAFYYIDLHRNKAKTQIERNNKRFNSELGQYIPKYIEDTDMFWELINNPNKTYIIVGAVDNHKTRQLIHKVLTDKKLKGYDIFWIDSGNEEFSGQIIIGSKNNNLPFVTEVFPEILNKKDLFKSEESCAERSVTNIQNISANIFAANLLFITINDLLSKGISFKEIYYNTENAKVNTIYIEEK